MLAGGKTVVTDLQSIQQAAARAREEIADQVAGSAAVQASASQTAAELERRRIALVLQGITDEKEKRVASINLRSALEAQAVEKLIAEQRKLGEITEAQADRIRTEFDALGEAARATQIGKLDGQIQGVAGSSRNASAALISLSQGIEDASFAGGNFSQVIRFSGGNVSQFVTQLGYARREAASTGRTVSSLLVSSLAGPAGLVVATSLLTAGLPLLIDKLSASEGGFRGSAKAAREARDAYREAYEAAIALEFASDAALDRQAEVASARFRAAQNRVGALDAERETLAAELAVLEAREAAASTSAARQAAGGAPSRALTAGEAERLRDLRSEVGSLNEQLENFRSIAADASEQLGRIGAEADAVRDLDALGLSPEDIAADAADAGRNAGAALGRGAAEGVRDQGPDVEAALAAALRVEADLRVESIESSRDREVDAVSRTLAERLAVARAAYGEGSALELAAVESAGRQVLEIDRRYAAEAEAEARRLAEARIDLQERYARLAGASEEELLERRVAAMRAAGLVTEEVELDLLDLRKRVADEGLQAALDAIDELLDAEERARRDREREEEREAERRLRDVEGYVDGVLSALRSAAGVRRRFTEEDVAAERAELAAREAELDESLRRRELSQREYDAEVRALAADRAAFEREAAEDSASAAVRALGSVVAFAREAALDFIQAEIAKAVASAIASAFATIPFPFNIAAAGGAAAAAIAAASLIPAFASGGPVVGPGGPTEDAVVARLSAGEHVLTAAEVRALGGHEAVERLRASVVATGVPRFALGGPVLTPAPLPSRGPSPSVAGVPAASGFAADLSGLEVRLGQLVGEVARLSREPAQLVASPEASRQLRNAGAQASSRVAIRSIRPTSR